MAPRIQVESDEFLEIARKEQGLIIMKGGFTIRGITYVIRSGDYYYFTIVRKPLPLPSECQVKEVTNILL